MSNQVFISYSSNDLQTADKVCVLLEAESIGCWIAPRDVLPGTIYAEEIIKAIENTEALVLICSRFTGDSVHVRSEVEHAFSQKKVIFPVRMEDVGLGKALEYFLGSSHWLAAWDSPLEECVKRLAESIKKVLAIPESGSQSAFDSLKNYLRRRIAREDCWDSSVVAVFQITFHRSCWEGKPEHPAFLHQFHLIPFLLTLRAAPWPDSAVLSRRQTTVRLP